MGKKVLTALGVAGMLLLVAAACTTRAQASPQGTPASLPPVQEMPGGAQVGPSGQKVEGGIAIVPSPPVPQSLSGYTLLPSSVSQSLPGYASSNSQQAGIWVSGQGIVAAEPDVALLTLGVEAQDKTVAEAQRRAREAMNAIIKVLKAGGVADKDIKTTSFSINQVTRWLDREGRSEVIGYWVSNMVSVKVRALDKVGALIDAVAEAGGDLTRIYGIGFTVDDPTPYLNAAREKAVLDAVAKAQQMARLAGATLGKPTYISEGTSYISTPDYRMKALGAAEAGPAPTPVSPGENEFSVSVQMVFAIE